jgi:hypothetical protein
MNVELRTKIKELLPHVRGLDSELAFGFMRESVDSFAGGTEVSDDELRQTMSEPKQAAEPFKMLFLQGTQAYRLHQLMDKPGMMSALEELAAIQAKKEEVSKSWRDHFRSIDQLEDGGVRFIIDGLFPEGTTFIGALPGTGKTWLGLSITKALVTKKKFVGKYNVPQRLPVLYLIPEVSSRAFKKRVKQMDIPADANYFLCRTISEGSTLQLDDPIVLEAVKTMKPVVILDTAIRFSTASDENAASQNKKLVDDIIKLRAAGAVAVIAFHHATKASAKEKMTMENTLRGTGDYAAMCDAAYGIRVDEDLYDQGRGPLELLVVCTKPRDISPQPLPFTLISKMRDENGKIVDVLETNKDFLLKDQGEASENLKDSIFRIVKQEPEITIEQIVEQLRELYEIATSKSTVNRHMQEYGYAKTGPVGPKRSKTWMCGTISLLELEKTD